MKTVVKIDSELTGAETNVMLLFPGRSEILEEKRYGFLFFTEKELTSLQEQFLNCSPVIEEYYSVDSNENFERAIHEGWIERSEGF